jgi:hypothetical protein
MRIVRGRGGGMQTFVQQRFYGGGLGLAAALSRLARRRTAD